MARVLVTGVDGFTGRYLARLLSGAGDEVHGLVHPAGPRAVEGIAHLHEADLTDAPAVMQAVQGAAPDHVVHLAAIAFVASEDVDAMYRVNLIGTRHLLAALSKIRQPPRAVLLASSANVYGNRVGGALAETTPPAPANDYAVSKLAMEHCAALFTSQLPMTIVRPFNYTGVGQSEDFLLPKIVGHARRGSAVLELGNLDVARDFSDVRDVVQIYARLLRSDAAVGRVVNVCSGKSHTLRDVLQMVETIAGRSLEIRVNPAFVRQNEVRELKGNRTLLEQILGGVASPRALVATLRWMYEDGEPA